MIRELIINILILLFYKSNRTYLFFLVDEIYFIENIF